MISDLHAPRFYIRISPIESLEQRTLLSVTSASAQSAASISAALNSSSDASIYMTYGSIKGDVAAEGYAGAIQLNSFRWGIGRQIFNGGSGGQMASAPQFSEIDVTKATDSASLPLLQEVFSDTPSAVTIEFVRQDAGAANPYLEIQLEDVLISSFSMSSGGDRPTESLSLNFTKITFTTTTSDTGSQPQVFSYDISQAEQLLRLGLHSAAVTAAGAPAAGTLIPIASATGADPIYMNYEGIKGDVTAAGYQDQIELNSFQWGVGRSIGGTGAGRQASAPSVSEIVVTKLMDSASVPLIREATVGNGADVSTAFAAASRGALQTYLQVDLSDTLINGYSMNSGGDRPSEALSLNFTKITFTALDPQGGLQTFSYDLARNARSLTAATAVSTADASTSGEIIPIASVQGKDPIYMDYGDIKGDVAERGFENQIELNSFQWGVGRGIGWTGAGREISAPIVSEIAIGKRLDSSSVGLLNELLDSRGASTAINFAVDSGRGVLPYLQIKLADTLISSYSINSGGDRPTESLSLNFTKITFSTLNADGSLEQFTYDLLAAKPQ